MNDVLQIRNNTHFNLRFATIFLTEPIHSVSNSSESASCLGLKIWEQIPNNFKTINYLVIFKQEIKKWKPINCPFRICKVFILNIGFV